MSGPAGSRGPLVIELPPDVRAVVDTLSRAGHTAVVVGGAVRDALRAVPIKDWDVATSARPEEVVRLFPHADGRSSTFGTVFVPIRPGDLPVEVTTFRVDGAYSDGRRPDSVSFGTDVVEDLARRDLTINAIAYEPARDRIHDPFGGMADLAGRRLRAVGDPHRRMAEDPLRAVRLARFAGTLGFDPDPATLTAAAGVGERVGTTVSPERIGSELARIAGAPHPRKALRVVADAGLVRPLFPSAGGYAPDRLRRAVADPVGRRLGQAGWLTVTAASVHDDERAWRRDADRLALGESLARDVGARYRVVRMAHDLPRRTLLRDLPDRGAVVEGLAVRRHLARAGLHAHDRGTLARRLAQVERHGLPRHPRDLALGGDVLLELGLRGREIGAELERLWHLVADGRLPNRREALLGSSLRHLGRG